MQIIPPSLRFGALAAIASAWFAAMGSQVFAVAPSAILLSNSTVPEICPAETLVGTLSATDSDPGDSHSFKFVAGVGDTYNHAFLISGNQLFIRYGLEDDFEVRQLYLALRVRATDSSLETFDQVLVIQMSDSRDEDFDGDGLTEEEEEDTYHTSDVIFDFDGDGVGDGTEVHATPPTSPLNPIEWPQTSIIGWGGRLEHELLAPEGQFVAIATGQNHSLVLEAGGTVKSWGGFGSFGQTTVPSGLLNVVAVGAGGDYWIKDSAHSLALKGDGTVVEWGYDHGGKIVAPAGLDQVSAISTGRTHCLALKNDRTVVAWGYNPHGRVTPPPDLSDVVAISAGGFHSLALKADGTVVAWGSAFDGTEWSEVAVPVGLCDVIAIAAGRFHNLALKSDGTVVAWGSNLNGQTDVPAGLNEVVALAAGGFHSMALKSDGTVEIWGSNSHGQASIPVSAQGGVKMISAGIVHSLVALEKANDPAITSEPRIEGTPGVALSHPVLVTHAIPSHFCAIGLPDGLAIDPGSGIISGTVAGPARCSIQIRVQAGQVVLTQSAWIVISEGAPPTAIALTPSEVVEHSLAECVVGVLSVVDPDEGDSHTFGWVDGSGSGDNARFRIEGNQLILDQKMTRDFEQNPAGFSIRVRVRDASLNPYEQVIAVSFLDDRTEDADGDGLSEAAEEDIHFTSDTLYDTDGDGFGDGFEVAREFAPGNAAVFPNGRTVVEWGNAADGWTDLPTGLEDVIDLSAGSVHSLALKGDGTVLAWGGNGDGQTTRPEVFENAIAVAAGHRHSLVLRSDGTVSGWGDNSKGQTAVPVDLAQVVAISAGFSHNLALKADGTVVAWGLDTTGQVTVPADLSGVIAVAAGKFHSLALKSDGTVVAWGWAEATAIPAGLSGVIAISAGAYHGLALKYDGTVVAWGFNDHGQSIVPAGLTDVTAIAAGSLHSLALKSDGTLVTWGDNSQRQREIPLEGLHLRKIAAGEFHNLAIRQSSGFPTYADTTPVRSWPGETITKPMQIQNAAAEQYSVMGLSDGLSIDPLTGVIEGTVTAGRRRSVRVAAVTDQGPLNTVVWFNTADGLPPTEISLSSSNVMENSPAATVVGTLSAADPNSEDTHVFTLAHGAGAPDSFRFFINGNQLMLLYDLSADYEVGMTQLQIRVVATDSGNNAIARDIFLQLSDDRTEDNDGDGINERTEEDVLGTGDSQFDDFNSADPDGDGIPSLIEHAFNLNPKTAGPPLRLVAGAGSTAGLPAIELVNSGPGERRLRLEYLRRVGTGLTYTPQFAGGVTPADWLPASNPVIVTPIDVNWERCVVEDSQAMPAAARRFGRVMVNW